MILAQKRTASENKELQLYNQEEHTHTHIYIYSIFYKKKKPWCMSCVMRNKSLVSIRKKQSTVIISEQNPIVPYLV